MYQRDPIIHVKPVDNDGFTVITITGPGAEEYAERFRKMIADDGKYACCVDVHGGMYLDSCVIDTNRHHDCTYAEELADAGKTKLDCHYWRQINANAKA